MELFDRLFDDETLLGREVSVAAMVADHLVLRESYGTLLATLAAPDGKLGELARHIPAGRSVPVSVISSGGAGGLLRLSGRALPGVEIVSAEPTLRDFDDLAGNAARVVSAVAELRSEVAIFVELPYARGWEAAVELVEGAGLYGKIAADEAEPRQTAEQLSVLIEADLPFKISSRSSCGSSSLLTAVAVLIDGASVEDAADLMQRGSDAQIAALASLEQTLQSRIRRRLRRLGLDHLRDAINDYVVAQARGN